MANNNRTKSSAVALTTSFTVTSGLALPSITWRGDHYEATCACVVYPSPRTGLDVEFRAQYMEGSWTDYKYVTFAGSLGEGQVADVGAPNALNVAEPQDIAQSGIDGSEALSALGFFMAAANTPHGWLLYLPDSLAEEAQALLLAIFAGWWNPATDFSFVIPGVWPAPAAPGGDFGTYDVSALTAAGASLWGGDGAGGERTSGGGVAAGTTLLSYLPSLNIRLLGVRCVFEPGGADATLACMLRVNGADAYPIPLHSGGESEITIEGIVTCASGDTVTLDVVRDNNSGGRVCAALIFEEA